MSLTIGNWIIVGVISIIIVLAWLAFSIWWHDEKSYSYSIDAYGDRIKKDSKLKAGLGVGIAAAIAISIIIGMIFTFNWYNTSTASGRRNYKDFKSNMNNGIYREITITNDDGKVIYDYTGKCDIEEQGDVDERKLKFENEQGKRVIIYYGITDTVKIIEKNRK